MIQVAGNNNHTPAAGNPLPELCESRRIEAGVDSLNVLHVALQARARMVRRVLVVLGDRVQ